jgi:hypothetical protein
VVTLDTSQDLPIFLRAMEIKLTALPDEQTHHLQEDKYGCEIVVRPDTIVYLALRLVTIYKQERSNLLHELEPVCFPVHNWEDPAQVRPLLNQMIEVLDNLILEKF